MTSVRMTGLGLWENIRICIRYVEKTTPVRSLKCWEMGDGGHLLRANGA